MQKYRNRWLFVVPSRSVRSSRCCCRPYVFCTARCCYMHSSVLILHPPSSAVHSGATFFPHLNGRHAAKRIARRVGKKGREGLRTRPAASLTSSRYFPDSAACVRPSAPRFVASPPVRAEWRARPGSPWVASHQSVRPGTDSPPRSSSRLPEWGPKS